MGKRKAGGTAPTGPSPSDDDGRAASRGHSNRNQRPAGRKQPTLTAAELVAQVEAHTGVKLKRTSGQWEGPCPNDQCPGGPGIDRFYIKGSGKYFCRKCCPDGKDKAAFLRLNEAIFGPQGKAKANGQDTEDPITLDTEPKDKAKQFHPPPGHEAQYDYTDAEGKPFLCVWRYPPKKDGSKPFRQAEAREDGTYRTPAPKSNLPLFRLPEVNEADPDMPVIVVEGEKCALALVELGYVATTWAGGTPATKKTDYRPLEGRDVILWPDNDDVGRKAMNQVAAILKPLAKRLRQVDVPTDKPPKWDAADATKREEVDALIGAASKWEAPEEKVRGLHGTDRPVVPKGADGFRLALDYLDLEVRYNERSAAIEWREKGKTWKQVDDLWEEGIRADLARKVSIKLKTRVANYDIGIDSFRAWIKANCYENGLVDDFREWLESLPPWDGVKRLDDLIEELFVVTEEERGLAAWAGGYIFKGAANRALKPGAEQHESPVLIGDPECGKSSFVKLALPPEHRADWFGSKLDMTASDQKKLESILGKVIVEMGEMAGMRKADHSTLKEFLGCAVDNAVRLPYRRNPGKHPRRCIFVGTSDKEECLPNDPNLRRFGVVRVRSKGTNGPAAHKRIEDYMDANREQLWAEALAWIKKGNKPNLPNKLRPAAKLSAEAARSSDSHLGDVLDQHHDDLVKLARKQHGLTMTEIVKELDLVDQFDRNPNSLTKRLGTELNALGWEKGKRKRREGKPIRPWYPPEE